MNRFFPGFVSVFALSVLLLGVVLASPLVGAEEALDPAALKSPADRAIETGSDTVVVYRHGTKVFDYHSSKPAQPLDIMSCTKSIVALAIGVAIGAGKIKSIDEPVYDFFPEWKQGRKKHITIRHLLTMTSGIQYIDDDVYEFPDSVKLALASEMQTEPGTAFHYNNKAVNVLAGVIHVATGEWLDSYVLEHLLLPLGIEYWMWPRDDGGNAFAFADLMLLPDDFAKFGILLLQHGMWNGKQLAPASFIDQLGEQSQPFEATYGYLWWRIPTAATGALTAQSLRELEKAGVDEKLIRQLRPLVGKQVHSKLEWHRLLTAAIPDWESRMSFPIEPYGNELPTWHYDSFDGIEAAGYLGQYLVVYPALDLVAVRQIKPFDKYDFMLNRFEDFEDVIRRLVPMVSK